MRGDRKIAGQLEWCIGVLSSSIIAFQLALVQLLSIMQWYHFAYMVISIALLGFGSAGTCLTFWRKRLLRYYERNMFLLVLATAITMALVPVAAQSSLFRFDSYLLFTSKIHFVKIVATCLLFMLPFLSGALALGLTFARHTENIGRLYCANLFGSGIGGLLIMTGSLYFLPMRLTLFSAILCLVSPSLFLSGRKFYTYCLLTGCCVVLAVLFLPSKTVLSQYKSLQKSLDLPNAMLKFNLPHPYGSVQVVSAPALRAAPCLSLSYHGPVDVKNSFFVNGNAIGTILSFPESGQTSLMSYTSGFAPYVLREPGKVLILDAGTGNRIVAALSGSADEITAVEPHPILADFVRKELKKNKTGNNVTLKQTDSRAILMRTEVEYDLISLPVANSFGGNAGLNAMQSNYLITVDSFTEMFKRLSRDGIISITCWEDYPLRYPLKVGATLIEAAYKHGINSPKNHLVAVKSWGTITFVFKRSPFKSPEIEKLQNFCKEMFFDLITFNGYSSEVSTVYNITDEQAGFSLHDLFDEEKTHLFKEYDFNILPATDNQPFLSRFLKLRTLPKLKKIYGSSGVPYVELGYLITWLTLVILFITSIFFILLPLSKLKIQRGVMWKSLLYFGALGAGYMFVEIVFINFFIFYLGNAVYSTSAVISFMLIASGSGSLLAGVFKEKVKFCRGAQAGTILFLMVYFLVLSPILANTIFLPFIVRLIITFLVVALPGFFMGFAFPTGLLMLNRSSQSTVPWAWGINGFLSVISSAAAAIISVEFGFRCVLIISALVYIFPLIINLDTKKSINHKLI